MDKLDQIAPFSRNGEAISFRLKIIRYFLVEAITSLKRLL